MAKAPSTTLIAADASNLARQVDSLLNCREEPTLHDWTTTRRLLREALRLTEQAVNRLEVGK